MTRPTRRVYTKANLSETWLGWLLHVNISKLLYVFYICILGIWNIEHIQSLSTKAFPVARCCMLWKTDTLRKKSWSVTSKAGSSCKFSVLWSYHVSTTLYCFHILPKKWCQHLSTFRFGFGHLGASFFASSTWNFVKLPAPVIPKIAMGNPGKSNIVREHFSSSCAP